MKKLCVAALFLFLPSCGGLPPIPWPPVPPLQGEYDCENPPELAGLIRTSHPILNQYIVVLKEPTPLSEFSNLLGVSGFSVIRGFSATISDSQVLTKLLIDPRVLYVQENGWKYATELWNRDRIDQRSPELDGLYDPVAAGSSVNVAIVDTGVTDHPDFGGRLADECFTAHTFGGCTDRHGHGTHVAGSAAGTTFGVAPAATLFSVRVLNEQGSGSDTDVINGLDWVIAQKQADPSKDWVINMSLGGSPAPALDAATCRAIDEGITVVVAAGNESQDAYTSSPARVKQAITVCAMEEGDTFAYFSNHGPGVDLCAPGVGIRSAKPDGGSQVMQGTSMASPHVAGAAAIVLGAVPGAAPSAVAERIVSDATVDALSSMPANTANLLLFVGKAEVPLPEPQCQGDGDCDCYRGQEFEACPEPQCSTFTDRGGNLRLHPASCDCYLKKEWVDCPEEECPFNTPTAAWMEANDYRCGVNPKREGRKNFGATATCNRWPDLADGTKYYCQPGLWPERCAGGQPGGPVAPDGHPKRVACERQFLQLDCPEFSYQSNTHMSFDPFYVINDVNQNHPRNVRVCGQQTGLEPDYEDHPSWKRDDRGYIKRGQWSIAMAAGNGKVCAEAKDGVAKACVNYREP
jgi:hypothetical protein